MRFNDIERKNPRPQHQVQIWKSDATNAVVIHCASDSQRDILRHLPSMKSHLVGYQGAKSGWLRSYCFGMPARLRSAEDRGFLFGRRSEGLVAATTHSAGCFVRHCSCNIHHAIARAWCMNIGFVDEPAAQPCSAHAPYIEPRPTAPSPPTCWSRPALQVRSRSRRCLLSRNFP